MGDMDLGDRETLENFILDNSELEKLEELTSKFNIFESLDVVRQEIRHSNFLAWVMNPNESHGIGDYFLKKFLLKTTSLANRRGLGGVTPIEIDSRDFAQATVQREWKGIDILITDEGSKFVCAIENKTESEEHSNQLYRYRTLVEKEFPDFTRQFVYLTPDASPASDDSYLNIGYSDVCDIIEYIVRVKSNLMADEVKMFLSHYTEMLRRRVLVKSEVQDLCKSIYAKHRKALDLIFEYKPDLQVEIHEHLTDLIKAETELVIDDSPKSNIRFGVKSWDVEMLQKGEGWTSSKRLLLFEFWNSINTLSLSLIIGPGDSAIRQLVYDIANRNTNLFTKANRKLTPQWFTIYSERFLTRSNYEDASIDTLKPQIEKKWKSFLSGDFRRILESMGELIRYDRGADILKQL